MSPHRKRRFLIFVQPKCPQCGPMVALIEKAALPLGIHVEIIDCTADTAAADRYHIKSTPTALLILGGKVEHCKSGRLSARELEEWLTSSNGG